MRHFTEDEFSDFGEMQPKLLARLDNARQESGVPYNLTSTYREGDEKSHGRGWAVDIACMESRDRFHIIRGLLAAGFTRIGIYDKHIHADCDPSLDSQVVWLGESR